MKLQITAEWLKSFGDDDVYEPSAYATRADLIELARRKEAIRQTESLDKPIAARDTRTSKDLVAAGQ